MSPIQWAILPIRKAFDFSGRSPRAEYWWFTLGFAIVAVVALVVDDLTAPANVKEPVPYALLTVSFLFLLPSLAVMVRRYHDLGRSGWTVLLILLPYVGAIWNLVYMVKAGQPHENEYGEPPYGMPAIGEFPNEPTIMPRS